MWSRFFLLLLFLTSIHASTYLSKFWKTRRSATDLQPPAITAVRSDKLDEDSFLVMNEEMRVNIFRQKAIEAIEDYSAETKDDGERKVNENNEKEKSEKEGGEPEKTGVEKSENEPGKSEEAVDAQGSAETVGEGQSDTLNKDPSAFILSKLHQVNQQQAIQQHVSHNHLSENSTKQVVKHSQVVTEMPVEIILQQEDLNKAHKLKNDEKVIQKDEIVNEVVTDNQVKINEQPNDEVIESKDHATTDPLHEKKEDEYFVETASSDLIVDLKIEEPLSVLSNEKSEEVPESTFVKVMNELAEESPKSQHNPVVTSSKTVTDLFISDLTRRPKKRRRLHSDDTPKTEDNSGIDESSESVNENQSFDYGTFNAEVPGEYPWRWDSTLYSDVMFMPKPYGDFANEVIVQVDSSDGNQQNVPKPADDPENSGINPITAVVNYFVCLIKSLLSMLNRNISPFFCSSPQPSNLNCRSVNETEEDSENDDDVIPPPNPGTKKNE